MHIYWNAIIRGSHSNRLASILYIQMQCNIQVYLNSISSPDTVYMYQPDTMYVCIMYEQLRCEVIIHFCVEHFYIHLYYIIYLLYTVPNLLYFQYSII